MAELASLLHSQTMVLLAARDRLTALQRPLDYKAGIASLRWSRAARLSILCAVAVTALFQFDLEEPTMSAIGTSQTNPHTRDLTK